MTTIFAHHRGRWAGWLLVALFSLPVQAQDMGMTVKERSISVSGEGIVRAEPDKATVRFGVVTRDEDPAAARQRNASAARAAMNAVRALGIEERKMRLETLSLQPVREYNPQTRNYDDKGYEAARQVVVEVEDLEKLPTLVAEVVQKGANRLDGIAYDLKNRDATRDEALRQALTNARDKARLMAETLDVSLGPVMTISEQSFDFPRPVVRLGQAEMALSKDAGAEPEAYAAGEIEVRAMVQVVFALQ